MFVFSASEHQAPYYAEHDPGILSNYKTPHGALFEPGVLSKHQATYGGQFGLNMHKTCFVT